MDLLSRIKRLVASGHVSFSVKAGEELAREGYFPDSVKESILNAPLINKKLRSHHPVTGEREYLYVIIGSSYDGLICYTKETIRREQDEETYYIVISSKRSIG